VASTTYAWQISGNNQRASRNIRIAKPGSADVSPAWPPNAMISELEWTVLRSRYSSSRCRAFQRPSRRRIRAELLLDFRFRFIRYFFFLDFLSESNAAISIFFTYRRHFSTFYVERPRFHAFHALHYSISLNALTLAPFHHVLRGTSKIPFTPFTPLRNFNEAGFLGFGFVSAQSSRRVGTVGMLLRQRPMIGTARQKSEPDGQKKSSLRMATVFLQTLFKYWLVTLWNQRSHFVSSILLRTGMSALRATHSSGHRTGGFALNYCWIFS
jgi:hypothetical protein